MKRVFIMIIALMFLLCFPLLSFAAGKPQPPSSEAFIPPAWSQKLPAADRFVLVLDGVAVLDKETGLVWERSPDATLMEWFSATIYCYKKDLGVRKGWRLPTIEELASLVDTSVSTRTKLPSGHPFTNEQSDWYWSSTNYPTNSNPFSWGVNMGDGVVDNLSRMYTYHVWCVRGGKGYDGY